MNILIVEDDPVNRSALAELLRLEGHKVDTSASALGLVHRLHSAPPDAVVLDVRLPGSDGLELLALIRRTPGWEKVPVVLATADPEVKPPTSEFTSLIMKPFVLNDLMSAIERAKS